MSHREKTTYYISGIPKSSISVDAVNAQTDISVSVQSGGFVRIFGKMDDDDKVILSMNFELYDDIFDETELSLLEE